MRKTLIISFMLIVFIFISNAQMKVTKIAAINLYSDTVDIRLGDEDNFIFLMEGLNPYTPTSFLKTEKTGTYNLYYKLSKDTKWDLWADKENKGIDCYVDPAKNYFIVVGNNGFLEYYTATEDKTIGPKVSFVNGAPDTVLKMSISTKWMDEPVAYIDGLDTNTTTNFVTTPKGKFSLFWQFEVQKSKGNYYYYPTPDGKTPEVINFANGKYYVFMVYQEDERNFANFFDITPGK